MPGRKVWVHRPCGIIKSAEVQGLLRGSTSIKVYSKTMFLGLNQVYY